ncbi:SAM-dependent methyltransferase [Frondihabitans sp. VKM Ac-2883]|uniref:class I SAM-dependent DNA methyltransferase n=1 Tax=Frondihabitans sp. VKM Ac-2883 TaxID=2783823 RepID=UPI00188BB997|nr:methyltransferase domain-containing protein [Frondihabitans sp. VKM Ac-2883]
MSAESHGTLRSHFEATHLHATDPWSVETSWYEIRKRAVLLAALPRERYGAVLEIGCSTGVLTEELAGRSDRILAVDLAESAVQTARERLAGLAHVRVAQGDVSDGLPAGQWDLVVVSEVAYYLDEAVWRDLIGAIASQFTEGGTVVACHWRHPASDFRQSGDAVHHALTQHPEFTTVVHHEEPDFVLDVVTLTRKATT